MVDKKKGYFERVGIKKLYKLFREQGNQLVCDIINHAKRLSVQCSL